MSLRFLRLRTMASGCHVRVFPSSHTQIYGSYSPDKLLADVGHILSSLTSSLIRLSLATTSTPTPPESASHSPSLSPHHHPHSSSTTTLRASLHTNPLVLLSRLIATLHTAYEKYDWDLAEPALMRAENVAACLRPSVDEFGNVVAALEGRFDLPAAVEAMGGVASGSGAGNVGGSVSGSSNADGLAPMDLDPGNMSVGIGGMDAVTTGNAGLQDVSMETGWDIDLNALGMDWVDEIIAGVGIGNGWAFGMGTGLGPGPAPGQGPVGVGVGVGGGGVSSLNGALGPTPNLSNTSPGAGTAGGSGMMVDGGGHHTHHGLGNGGAGFVHPHAHQLHHPQQQQQHHSHHHPGAGGGPYGMKVNVGGGPIAGPASATPVPSHTQQQQQRRRAQSQHLQHPQFGNSQGSGVQGGGGSGSGGYV